MTTSKKIIFFTLFLALGSTLFIGLGEGGLFLTSRFFKKPYYNPVGIEDKDDYPDRPNEYFKIAIYGGSAAYGYLSEKNFSDILSHNLLKNFPNKKFYIKNYAKPGHPFHKVQAVFANDDVEKFDLQVFYTGTNEGQVYIDDSGYFRKNEYKDSKFKKFPDSEKILQTRYPYQYQNKFFVFIQEYSRIYSFTKYLLSKILPKKQEQQVYQFWNFNEFSNEIIFPKKEVENIYNNFRNDLTSIIAKSKSVNKKVILVTEVTNHLWKPGFSIFSDHLSEDKKIYIKNEFKNAVDLFNQAKFNDSKKIISNLIKIDNEPAILHHYLGLIYFSQKNFDESLSEFELALLNDPWHARATPKTFSIQRELSSANPQTVTYVDVTSEFFKMLKSGLKHEELYSDFMHPNILGHMIIGNKLTCEVSRLLEPSYTCDSFDPNQQMENVKRIKETLKITDETEKTMLFLSARFNIGMSDYVTAYPDDILNLGEYFLEKYISKFNKDNYDQIRYLIFKALAISKRNQIDTAINLLNQGLIKYKNELTSFLNESLNNGLYVSEAFLNRGILFDQTNKVFVKRNK